MRARGADRPKRTPLGRRNILTTEERKGFVRRWVNDVDDRLTRAEAAGYQRVLGDVQVGDPGQAAGDATQLGSPVSKSVGGGVTAYLMEIPEGFFAEDKAAKLAEVDAREAALRPKKGEGQYGSLEINAGKRRQTPMADPEE